MEWREQSSVSCDEAYLEAQRWIEAVTKKKFGSSDFRSALENGVLLCELINNVKPGTIRRVNRLPTPIAGLDNLNIFLRACGKLRLKEAQLFHPGDLQDLSTRVTVKAEETNRRLKNVLITIYWLGRRAQCDPAYNGPHLNLKAFEGLLGTALYKALQESSSPQKDNSILRDSGFGDSWYSEQEYLHHFQNREAGHRRDDSLDSLDSLGSRPHSISSDIKGSSEGFFSDTEQDPASRMADKDNLSYRRSAVLTPRTATQFNQFLPSKDKASGYVPAPLRKKRQERNEDNRRSLTSPYSEDDIPLTRQLPGQDSLEGSKSTSDIDMEQSAARQLRYEEMQKYRERIKESDDKWQDDLSKWKNRRRSVNSDIVKKKEEREKIEETFGSNRKSKTFKEMQEDREKRQSLGSRLGSLSYLDDEDVFAQPASTPRTPYSRSYTIDSPYSSSLSTSSTVTEKEPPAASPATGRASSPTATKETVDLSADTETTITSTITPASYRSHQRSPSPLAAQHSSLQTTKTTAATSSLKSELKVQEPKSPLLVPQTEVPSVDSRFKPPQQQIPMEPKPPVVSRVSASLPRSFQRSDSARITSVVAPRPFPGSQATRLSSLSRAYTTDDSHKPVNGDLDTSKKSSVPSRYHQFMTSEDEAQSSSAHSSDDEDDQEESTEKVITENKSAAVEITSETTVTPAPLKDSSQESFCEMRISLNQKPNSSRDFGFQSVWDSTGARVTSIVPGSSAEMCQLQPGDEVVTVNGHQVADMSYTSWKTHMEEALQEGSLVMDIRRHGKNSAPESKTFNSSLDFTSHLSNKTEPVKDAIAHSVVIDVASNGLNGSLRDEPVTMRNKDSEPISLKNLKRRSEFFEQGGTEPVIPEIPVPSIAPPSSRWSWDPEEERKRQEKWQKEQERLLQEKYKRDQEKLQEEWFKAQQEITSTQQKPASLEVNNQSTGPHSPLSPVSQPLSSLWEEQERRRKEELEQRRQAEERELQRLREERERREQQEEEERRKREEEEKMRQMQEEEKERQRRKEEEEKERRKKEEEERRRRAQEMAEQQQRERERALEIQQQQLQQQWAGSSHVQPTLSFADSRMRSKSSPQLDDERPQQGVMGSVAAQRGQQSQAELERQQVLKDMKKKAPLLTDSSWIRQRSATTSTGSSRDSEGALMRRGESLDNLDTNNYNMWRSSWTPRTNSYIPNYSRPQSALSGSTSSYGGWFGAPPRSSTLPSSSSLGSLRGGAGTPSSNWSRQTPSPSLSSPSPTRSPEPLSDSQQRSRSVSGKKICTYCDTPLGKGAAMIIESLGLCYHLGCFKCFDCGSDLGGSEAGAEVRIRNKHLYCNTCYVRFKTGQPTSM